MPAFQPELLRVIASHVPDSADTFGRLDDASARLDQSNLHRFMLVSKTSHEQASSYLYRDCFVARARDFYKTIEDAPKAFGKTARIRFGHQETPLFEAYRMIILTTRKNMWPLVDVKSKPGEPAPVSIPIAIAEADAWMEVADLLDERREEDNTALASLERVVMGELGNSWWHDMYGASRRPEMFSYSDFCDRPSLGRHFIQHKPVKHYCQSEMFGPFALPCATIKSPHPPEVVTYHMPIDFFGTFHDLPDFVPPVVVGAINRYIFPRPKVSIVQPGAPSGFISRDDRSALIRPIVAMLRRKDMHVLAGAAPPTTDREPDLSNTTIELYNYIERRIMTAEAERRFRALLQVSPVHGPTDKKGSIRPLQECLEKSRTKHQPRVLLKALSEAPKCTACGLDSAAALADSQGVEDEVRVVEVDNTVHIYI